MAWLMARRTRTSFSGAFLLLMATMPLPDVLPTSTTNRLSPWNCFSACSAPKRGMPSMSPASSAATCAAGSLMKRKITFFTLILAASR